MGSLVDSARNDELLVLQFRYTWSNLLFPNRVQLIDKATLVISLIVNERNRFHNLNLNILWDEKINNNNDDVKRQLKLPFTISSIEK